MLHLFALVLLAEISVRYVKLARCNFKAWHSCMFLNLFVAKLPLVFKFESYITPTLLSYVGKYMKIFFERLNDPKSYIGVSMATGNEGCCPY